MVDSVILQKQRKWHATGWFWALIALFVVILMLLPVATIAYLAFFPKENIWPHLLETTLPRYLSNSLIVMSATAIASIICGTAAAWLVVMKQFPGRRILEWALFLPLSIPTYIGAYALVDFWEYAGPFQTLLRDSFGWAHASDYWFPQVRTRGAAIFVFTLALYPYVYLMARSAFKEQSISAYETARTLGAGPWAAFFKIGLPLARPAIVVGASIVMMETLNDFGAVEFFAVQTLTTGIFTIWLEAQNAGGAAQIAIVMLLLVLGLMLIERSSRKQRRYYQLSKNQAPIVGEPLSRGASLFAAGFCAALVGLGFVMPVAIMAEHALDNAELWLRPKLWSSLFNTVWTSGM
ncbi:MAG: iron ABC transporter permease, partial [Rhodobacteraceae bacterium]